jgi:hypothetical protein
MLKSYEEFITSWRNKQYVGKTFHSRRGSPIQELAKKVFQSMERPEATKKVLPKTYP